MEVKDFMLIMRATRAMNSIPTEKDLAERKEWLADIEKRGLIVQKGGATPASPDAVAKVFSDGSTTDGFDVNATEFIVGYLVIKAEDINEAKNIALSNPLVKAGGTIEVRQILLRELH